MLCKRDHYPPFVIKGEALRGGFSICSCSSALINLLTGSLEIIVGPPGWVGPRVTEVPAIASCFLLSVKIRVFLAPGLALRACF